MYGGGDAKIGAIIGKGSREGAELKNRFLKEVPALAKLLEVLTETFNTNGSIRGLDGRRLFIKATLCNRSKPRRVWQRSTHKALNVLLQSAGALVMKKALVILDTRLQEAGLKTGEDYEFVLNVHDEFQIEALEKYGEFIGQHARQSIIDAGKYFKMRCPLDGEYKVGRNWAETH